MIRALDQLVSIYGGPEALRMDNGPELISEALMAWCGERDITMHHIQPGKPDQNAYIERLNRSYREEVLDAHLFGSIEEAQAISDEWLEDCNTDWPHDGLGPVPSSSLLPRKPIPGESSFELSH